MYIAQLDRYTVSTVYHLLNKVRRKCRKVHPEEEYFCSYIEILKAKKDVFTERGLLVTIPLQLILTYLM